VKRLLVTGVSGLLGSNMAVQAADRYEVFGVMRGGRALPAVNAPFRTLLADLVRPGEVERVLDEVQPEIIIHSAALTHVDQCELHPEEAYAANADLPRRLALAARERGARLLHVSTDAVFDGERGSYTEEDQPNPINIYARTKLAGERFVADANSDALIARVIFYGWSWQGQRSLAEFFFRSLSAGIPVTGFSDVIFCPLLVNDMIEIFLRMVERGLNGLYHVVSAECQTKYGFALMLARQFGFNEQLISPAPYHSAGLKALRSPNLTLSTAKLARALGEELPIQVPAMERFHALYCQGYPQSLRSMLLQNG
jgi:dTDP-4-dehydrorhamnose reductase